VSVPEDYLARVAEVHEKGGYGSIGYRYDWKREEAMKNILRTHTTAVSARMLYQIANVRSTQRGTRQPAPPSPPLPTRLHLYACSNPAVSSPSSCSPSTACSATSPWTPRIWQSSTR